MGKTNCHNHPPPYPLPSREGEFMKAHLPWWEILTSWDRGCTPVPEEGAGM